MQRREPFDLLELPLEAERSVKESADSWAPLFLRLCVDHPYTVAIAAIQALTTWDLRTVTMSDEGIARVVGHVSIDVKKGAFDCIDCQMSNLRVDPQRRN